MADRQAGRLTRLIAASQSLAAIESLDQVLAALMDQAKEAALAEASALLLYDPQRRTLRFCLASNDCLPQRATDSLRRNFELELGQGVAGWVAARRTSALVNDVAQDPRFYAAPDQATGFVTRSLLAVPICYQDELLGVIEVLNPKDRLCFDSADQQAMESFAHLAAVAIVRARLLAERLREERLRAQVEAAARIQSHFRPHLPPLGHGSGLFAASLPACEVSGDLYDCQLLADGRCLVTVADVAGKGLPAALVMTALWAALRSQEALTTPLPELLRRANASLLQALAGESFATACLVRYDPATGQAQVASAGHLAPLRVAWGRTEVVAVPLGLPLGGAAQGIYHQAELTVAPGESLVLLTDGVTEGLDPEGRMLGHEAVGQLLASLDVAPRGPSLLRTIERHLGAAGVRDDVTMVEIWRDALATG